MTWNPLDASVLSFVNNPDTSVLTAVSWNLLQPLHMYFKCLVNSLLYKICVPWEKHLIKILISSLAYKNYLFVTIHTLTAISLFFVDNGPVNLCWWFLKLFVKLKINNVILILLLKSNFQSHCRGNLLMSMLILALFSPVWIHDYFLV